MTQFAAYFRDQWRRSFRSRYRYTGIVSWLQRNSKLGKFLYRIFNERLTTAGRFILCASLATGIAASFQQYTVGSPAFSAFTAIIVMSFALSVIRPPKLRVTRHAPERCVAGASVPVTITVENTKNRSIFDIGAFEYRMPPDVKLTPDPQYLGELEAGRLHTFSFSLSTEKRGSYKLPGPTLVSAFPFGMMQSRRFYAQPHRLIVYPSFKQIRTLHIPAGTKYQPGGLQLTSRVGQSMEFIGNREYQQGDRINDLHPRSWARVGYPVVKQFQEEYLTRVAVLVDTFLPRGEPMDVLEANLSMTAAIADALARKEYVVDLFAAGPELYHFQAGRSLAYLDNILDILAVIQRCKTDPFDIVAPKLTEDIRQISTMVLVLLSWDQRRIDFVRNLRDQGVEVKVIVVTDDRADASHLGGMDMQHFTVDQIRNGVDTV